MITISFNGEPKQVENDVSLSALLQETDVSEQKVAVAINGEFMPRSQWESCQLEEGDQLDVLTAVQGG